MESLLEFIDKNILFLLLCAVFIYIVFNSGYYSEHFESQTQKVLTLYYAPWCPHCKPVRPVFEELKKIYAGNNNVSIITVNGDEEPEKLKEEGIKGYPTIMLTVGGKNIKFEGERTAQKLQEFIQSY